ncbi:MAG: monovalent cation/H(+) antiporter subunit G [Planctomycetota bacterium]
MADYVASVLLPLGLFLNLVGCLAVVRMPDALSRLHAGVRCTTLGTCLVLAGVLLFRGMVVGGLAAGVSMALLWVLTPVAAGWLARAIRSDETDPD